LIALAGSGATAGVLSSSVAVLSEGFLASLARARTVRIAAGLAGVALAALVLLLLLNRSQPEPAPVATTQPALPAAIEQQAIQGVWHVIRMEAEAGAWTWSSRAIKAPWARPRHASWSTDTPLPHEITMFPKQGDTWLGIYELEGDYLRICLNQGGLQRPTTFPNRAKGTVFLYELRREAAVPQR
jgi:hypothetical protein